MSSSGYGQAPKKETVYSGPTPTPKQGTVYNGPSVQTAAGTVYNGPTVGTSGGTVYNGPAPGGTVYGGPANGTVIRPVSGPSSGTVSAASSRAAKFFFAIAGLTIFRAAVAYFLGGGALNMPSTAPASGVTPPAVLVVDLLIAAVFGLIGFFTQAGSKIAFLIGMVLYAADTVLLLISNPALHVVAIIVHVLILVSLFKAYRELPE